MSMREIKVQRSHKKQTTYLSLLLLGETLAGGLPSSVADKGHDLDEWEVLTQHICNLLHALPILREYHGSGVLPPISGETGKVLQNHFLQFTELWVTVEKGQAASAESWGDLVRAPLVTRYRKAGRPVVRPLASVREGAPLCEILSQLLHNPVEDRAADDVTLGLALDRASAEGVLEELVERSHAVDLNELKGVVEADG